MSNPVQEIGNLFESVGNLAESVVKTVGKTIENIAKNPLQAIEVAALTYTLGPAGLAMAETSAGAYAIANAAVSAANGGSVEKIAIAAAASYAGGQIGGYAGNVASEMGMTDATLKQIVVTSSASASAAALSGKPLDQILAAGASGAIGTIVRQNLIDQGFDPKGIDTKLITNASTAAANAIITGKDINLAIGNALASTTMATAIAGASDSVKTAYKNLTDNTTKLGELNNKFYEAQSTASSYFKNTVEPLQQDAQQKYDNAIAAQDAYNSKNAEYQAAVNEYNDAVSRNDVNAANAAADRANALIPDVEALATAYNSAADQYLKIAPELQNVQNTYKGYADTVKDLGTQLDATNKVVEQGVKDTATALYNTTSLKAPEAVVTNDVKSTLDTVTDANATALQNAQASGNSLLIQAVLDGNAAAITALAKNDISGAEAAVKGALEATKPDLSQGDVNTTTLPTTPVSTTPETTLPPVVVTPTPKPEGETSGTGTTGTDTGNTTYPIVDNGDGTSSQVNTDGSVTTFDNTTGNEIATEAPNTAPVDTTTPADQQATQDIVNTVNGPTSPFEVKPTDTTPVTTTDATAPATTTDTTAPATTTPTEPVAPYVLGQVTNKDGSITTTYSDGTTTTTPGTGTGTTTTPGGTDVLSGGTGTGTTSGTGTTTGTGTGTGTTTGGTGTTGTTGGTGTTTTTGGTGTTTGSGAGTTAATIAGGLSLLGSGSTGTQTLGGVALPEAKLVKGTQIASPLASKYDVPVYKTQQSTTDQGDILQQIQEAATGGLIHMADGGEVFPAAQGLYRGRRSQFANPLAQSLTSLAPTALAPLGHADGGSIEGHNPQFFSEGGLNSLENKYVKGDGDGTSDSVPAMLANGEFVIPADVVSSLGNGSNDAGAEVLDKFLVAIRNHKKQTDGKNLPPDSKGPLAYLLAANKKVRA